MPFASAHANFSTSVATFTRIIHKPTTLSDSFFIPAGTHVASPAHAIGMDPALYPNPTTFDGFRFSNLRSQSSGNAIALGQLQWASANLDSMAFGYGRHACPGRFFASNEIKMILAEILMQYDFKLEKEGVRPVNLEFETQLVPNQEAKILLRMRQRELE